MKIIVLHGDNFAKSDERLKRFAAVAKKRGWEIARDSLDVTPSLFGLERLIVIKDLKLINPKSIRILEKIAGTLILYSDNTLSKTFLKTLPNTSKIEEFKLPKVIWNFLDNPKLKLLHEVIKNEPAELVFVLLARRFRDLYWLKADPKTLGGQPWQISRLRRQADQMTTRELARIIGEMAKIDTDVKTGRASLIPALDFMLATKLE